MRLQLRQVGSQLNSHGSDKLVNVGEVAAAARKREACAEPPCLVASTRHRAGNSRLARAGDAVQPENMGGVVCGAPLHDFVKQDYTRALVAQRRGAKCDVSRRVC